MSVEFEESRRRVVFDEVGIEVDGRMIPWSGVGALGVVANAGRAGVWAMHMGGPVAGKPLGCLGVCVVGEVDVVPGFGLMVDCLGTRPTAADYTRFESRLRDELGELFERIPQFAPPRVKIEDWWRSQVYGPDSHAHTDLERIKELRAEIAEMRRLQP